MHILEISSEPPGQSSGIGRSVRFESSGLQRLGHDVTVLHPRFRIGEFKLSTIGLRRYAEYDVVHVHGPTPLLSDLTLITNAGLPIVYTHYAEVEFGSRTGSQFYLRIHRSLARKARRVIVWTNEYARLFDGKATVIPPPISMEPPERTPVKRDRFTALYVGQLRPFKGVDVLIAAGRLIPEADVWIVGDGWYKDRLLRAARGLENIRFLGPIYEDSALREVYSQAHVTVLPSLNTTEAYGLVSIEGALHGAVPVASDLLGVRENIAQLEGVTFPAGDARELAGILRRLAQDSHEWQLASAETEKRARTYVETHSVEAYARQHEAVFEAIR